MKRVKQVLESKRMIADATVKLLSDSELIDIPISKITEEAKVSRMTFYRYFETKEDVIIFIIRSVMERLHLNLQGIPNYSFEDILLKYLELMKNDYNFITILKNDYTRYIFLKFREKNKELFYGTHQDYDSYREYFNIGGMDYALVRWVDTGMVESPETMVTKIMTLLR